jgi:hypothetical protein
VRRFAVFNLSDQRELDDVCAAGGVNAYHKSLLYLVSRALEVRAAGQSEAPLLGMAKFFDRPLGRGTLRGEIRPAAGTAGFPRRPTRPTVARTPARTVASP